MNLFTNVWLTFSMLLLRTTSKASLSKILIYNGDGTMYVDVLIKSLADVVKLNYDIRTISAAELHDSDWMSKTRLLVIPGGRDIPYTKDIREDAIHNIHRFIENGGSYLGLCAGAYFACSKVSFEKGTPLEVIGVRNLQLFKGTANGSVYPGFQYNSTDGQRMVPLRVNQTLPLSGDDCFVYFDGGCEFLPDDSFSEYETIATYRDFSRHRKAIVAINRGNGKILLSGVHPEMDPLYLNQGSYTHAQWMSIKNHADLQRKLLRSFLEILL